MIEERDDLKTVEFWQAELTRSSKHESKWRERAEKVVDRYRDEEDRKDRRFNILWANIEILKPATLSQTPKPDVRRRYLDEDPVGREASIVLERALEFCIDDYEFIKAMERVRDDGLLTGRGIPRIKYESELVKIRPEQRTFIDDSGNEHTVFVMDQQVVDPDGEDDDGAFIEQKENERTWAEYVYWKDFRMSVARTWTDVWWVAFRHMMKREELEDAFGKDKGSKIPLTVAVKEGDDPDKVSDSFKRAEVWEIWDKEEEKRVWIAEGFNEIIETEDDPLELNSFFPCPEPLYFLSTTDTMVPLIEYRQYQDQAIELDRVTERIDKLIAMLKVAGLYDAVQKELVDLMSAQDGELLPIESAQAMRDKGGLQASIFFLPIEQIAKVLSGLIQHRESLKQEIFELTGISDLFRGATQAQETATAQRIKGNFGNLRLQPKQEPMQRLIRDVLRLKAEIMAELFSQDNLSKMTGMQVSDEVMALLRDDKARSFKVDIETHSTVQPDKEQEKRSAVEFMGSMSEMLANGAQIVQMNPLALPLIGELIKFTIRRFDAGRNFEETVDRTLQAMQEQAQQPPPEPTPDPNEVLKSQTTLQKAELDNKTKVQIEQMQAQLELLMQEREAEVRGITNLLDVAASS